jgi:hypothetical protein
MSGCPDRQELIAAMHKHELEFAADANCRPGLPATLQS